MSGSPLNTVNALFGGSINYGFQAGQVGQVNNYNYGPTLEEVKQKQETLNAEVAAWLSPLDFPQRQKEILQSWQARTGNWFLQRAEFKDWEDVKDDYRTLFCPGQRWYYISKYYCLLTVRTRGCWEDSPCVSRPLVTYVNANQSISSRVVEHLLKQREQEDLVLSIFCSHDSRELHTVENLTGSLLRQVSQQSGEIPRKVQDYYERNKGSRPKLKNLLETLKVQFRRFQKVYIVVDALDECSTIDSRQGESYNPRTTFLASLQELLKAAPNAAIMITSRPLPALQNQLQWPQIDIAAQNVDISVFLDAQIKMAPRIASYKQDDLIKNKIIANTQGM
jgi:NACHT domain